MTDNVIHLQPPPAPKPLQYVWKGEPVIEFEDPEIEGRTITVQLPNVPTKKASRWPAFLIGVAVGVLLTLFV